MKKILALAFASSLLLATPSHADIVQAGTMHYNSATRKMEFYDGHAWYNLAISLALGGCGTEGAMDYDALLVSYKYCNGTSWVRVIGVPTLAVCSKAGQMEFSNGTFLVCNGLLWTNIKGPLSTS
jgi:hypothetical protein